MEARGLANRSERFTVVGRPGPVDKGDGFGWAGLAQGPSINVKGVGGQVRGLGARLAQGLLMKVRGLTGRPIEARGFGCTGAGAASPPSFCLGSSGPVVPNEGSDGNRMELRCKPIGPDGT